MKVFFKDFDIFHSFKLEFFESLLKAQLLILDPEITTPRKLILRSG